MDSSWGTNTSQGYLKLVHHDGLNHDTFPMYMDNNIWCHYSTDVSTSTRRTIDQQLSSRTEWKVCHHHYSHCNDTTIENVYKYARGAPKLKKSHFYMCSSYARTIKKEISSPTRITVKKDLHA